MHTTYVLKGLAAAALVGGVICSTSTAVFAQSLPASFASRAERCAVQATAPETLDMIEKLAGNPKDTGSVVTIPVYWHVVVPAGGSASNANISSRIPAQMNVLRDAYVGSGFAFEVKAIDVIENTTWYTSDLGSPEEAAMKAALRRGGADALNIYTTDGDVYLGWATLPFSYKFSPSSDGVVLWWAALPGTGLEATGVDEEPDGVLTYDQGDTGTHEVGHWLGLEHTFGPGDGSCSKPGDKIKDTPTEAEPQFFCQVRNSCVGANNPGDDPITNFMDYVDDVCMDHFTPDQTKRMRTHWNAFRAKKAR